MQIALSFPHEYEVELLTSVPTEIRESIVIHPKGTSLVAGVPPAGVVVRFRLLDGVEWIAIFPRVQLTPFSGIFAAPSPKTAFVVIAGMPYLVDVEHKHGTVAEPVGTYSVVAAHEAALLLALSATSVVAYDGAGARWTTRRLSFDGIEISSTSDSEISGTGWDPRSGTRVPFTIQVRTGDAHGGAAPGDEWLPS